MRTTINQLRVELEILQQAYAPLNSFFWGSFERSQDETATGITYPLMCAYYNNGSDMKGNTVPINLIIVIADRVYDDFSNLNDTESDTLQVCKDIVNIMTTSRRWNRICRITSAVPEKFIEAREDKVTGHFVRLTVTLLDNKDICNVPVFGYDFDTEFAPQCAPVTVTDSDGTTVVEVDSGGSFICTPVAEATYSNSDDSVTGSIPPGGHEEFDDIQITTGSGVITRPALVDVSLPDYYQILAPTGSRVPVNAVSDPSTQTLWTSKSATVSTGTGFVQKNAIGGWDGRANFIIETNLDFELFFKIPIISDIMTGISMINILDSFEDIDFAFYTTSGGGLVVYSDGLAVVDVGLYNVNDILSIRRENGEIKMLRNGTVLYTFTTPYPFPIGSVMLFDCSLFTASSRVENISISF